MKTEKDLGLLGTTVSGDSTDPPSTPSDEGNLRGARVLLPHPHTGRPIRGEVITRTRGTRWMIEAGRLPERYWRWDGSRRIILDRSEFKVTQGPRRGIGGRR